MIASGEPTGSGKVLVCGGREFRNYSLLVKTLDQIRPGQIIHGAARGADRMAGRYASTRGIPCESFPVFPEDWDKHGKRAGFLRNQQMLDEGRPDLVVAFPRRSRDQDDGQDIQGTGLQGAGHRPVGATSGEMSPEQRTRTQGTTSPNGLYQPTWTRPIRPASLWSAGRTSFHRIPFQENPPPSSPAQPPPKSQNPPGRTKPHSQNPGTEPRPPGKRQRALQERKTTEMKECPPGKRRKERRYW